MSRSVSAWVNHPIKDFTCPITQSLFFDPVITCNVNATCGHLFEKRESVGKLQKCPCCREDITLFSPALHTKNTLDEILLAHPALWRDVYFNLDHFAEVFTQENGLKTQTGIRFIRLLEHASNHVNDKAMEGTQHGKSAIEILASTLVGRDLLRKKLKIESGKFFFRNAEISAESLQTQVNGKSIREWLSITTAMEVMQEDEQKARQAIDIIAQCQLQAEFSRARLFLSRDAQAAAARHHRFLKTVNFVLQDVVYGQEGAVKAALESAKSNTTQLSALLSDTSTVKDYSDRTITGLTLLQAAACAGDLAMCQMIGAYLSPEEVTNQLTKIFPNGVKFHKKKQKCNAFNFDVIFAAIRTASTADIDVALYKQNNGSALCRRLEEFRHQFTEISHNEKIFNPQHLLRAFEVYNALWNQCEGDANDRGYKQRDLFWRQIIGFVQRFMPACYAQDFAQGLDHLVRVDRRSACQLELFNRTLEFKYNNCPYFFPLPGYFFPLPSDSRSGLGFDVAVHPDVGGWYCSGASMRKFRTCFKNFCQAKIVGFQNLMSPGASERRCLVQ